MGTTIPVYAGMTPVVEVRPMGPGFRRGDTFIFGRRRASEGVSRRKSRCPGPLEVEAAEVAGDVEDFADEPCAPKPHGEGGEHADEEGADPPDVVSMVGHDRPEGVTRGGGATTPCSGLFLCGCGRRRPFLRRLLGRGLLALLSGHSGADANRPSCQHWAPCG